jgi:dephospho-CoA kinase
MNSIITIGITGGIGSGKSYICSILEATGYSVFYSDKVAKNTLATDIEVVTAVKNIFGASAYQEDGSVNRSYLASKIFSDNSLRVILNELIHPKVRAAFKTFASAQSSQLVFNEAAIIFETGGHTQFDKTILVSAPEALKIERLLKRDQSDIFAIKKRMDAQWSDEKKRELADFEIVNDQVLELLPQIMRIIEQLKS